MVEITRVRTISAGRIAPKVQIVSEEIKTEGSSPIGMFDSGVGGLTTLREVQKQLPVESVIYIADTARVPFGGRPKSEIVKINHQIIGRLMELGVKMIIMACGTSSALAYPVVKDKYKLPLISIVEPGARAAVSATRNKKIGVIATVATAGSHAYRKAIKAVNSDIEVYEVGCPLFVPLIEGGFIDSEDTKKVAKEYLSPLIDAQVDTLILGCTHYPHLSRIIESIMGRNVVLIDTAEETVKEAKQILLRSGLASTVNQPPQYQFLVTGDPDSFSSLGSKLLGKPLTNVKQVTLISK